MDIRIRADSSTRLGTGHVMRCLALAGSLRERGATVSFICRELPGNINAAIEACGHVVYRLPTRTGPHLGDADWRVDAEQTACALATAPNSTDWLIVDHYALDRRWEAALRPHIGHVMVIDDLANRSHDCDLLLDQNLCENADTRYDGLTPAHCRIVLGPRYALLRPEFLAERQEARPRGAGVGRVLIFFGGTDPGNETAKALEAIRLLNRPDLAVDVVVGGTNPHKHEVEALCATLPGASFYCQASHMAQLMARADLAIGAGGSTMWERCCLYLPSLVVIIAENQIESTEATEKAGAIINLGWFDHVSSEALAEWITRLIRAPDILKRMSEDAGKITHGDGADLVASMLI